MGWRDKYNEWRETHDFKQYESRKKCDEVIDQKLVELLDEQEAIITQLQNTSSKKKYTASQATQKSRLCDDCIKTCRSDKPITTCMAYERGDFVYLWNVR